MSQALAVVIVGFGGHGRVVRSALQAAGVRVVGATDLVSPSPDAADGTFDILSDDQLLERHRPADVLLVAGVGSIWPTDSDAARWRSVRKFTDLGYRFIGVRHPFAWVAADSQVGETSQIHAGAVVQAGAVVGEFTIVNTRASIDHDCCLGDFCHIGPGATLSGNVEVGEGSHLGTGCTVIQGIKIGKRCMIAAGATVVHDVDDGQFVRGTPARPFTPNPHR